MKIIVDADACPVKDIITDVAAQHNVLVQLVVSPHHCMSPAPGVEVIIVDPGPESVDMAIANRVQPLDVVITQDYGLAAMVLGKKALALSPRGNEYTEHNIEGLLFKRYLSAKIRRGGGKTKGPAAFTNEDRNRFRQTLINILHRVLTITSNT